MTSSRASGAPSAERPAKVAIPDEALRELEAAVHRALHSGDVSELDVLGYGEITSVLACHRPEGGWACKRLPPFPDLAALERYRGTFARYLERLEESGISVLPSSLHEVKGESDVPALWCVQPLVERERFLVRAMGTASPDEACTLFEVLLERLLGAVGPMLGIDAQASNWVLDGKEPLYIDVTTPMMRRESGEDELDIDLFLASLPFVLREATRRFLLGSILDKYYSVRAAAVDFLGNLVKERLERLVPRLLPRANQVVEPAITEAEVAGYYRRDARMWSALLWMRRMDRAWQRRVRRRPYPFLLPGRIDRNV